MKKILLTIGLAAFVSSYVQAQGNFVFSTTAGAVWDDWSLGFAKRTSSNNVAFLIGNGASLVGELGPQTTPTNGTSASGAAWTAILNDPNYRLATNSGSGLLVSQRTTSLGGINYNGGATFTVAGTAAAGGSISVFVIGWSYIYDNPFLAAAAGSAVGWSLEFNYAYGAGPVPGPSGTPGNFTDAGLTPFGVAAVPEPTTLALAGLGAASLLIFRKRKQ